MCCDKNEFSKWVDLFHWLTQHMCRVSARPYFLVHETTSQLAYDVISMRHLTQLCFRTLDDLCGILFTLSFLLDIYMTLNIDLPDEKPRITGIKEKYQIGETLEALCTSWQSHPPANLTWFINEEKVRLNQTTINYIFDHSHNKTSINIKWFG